MRPAVPDVPAVREDAHLAGHGAPLLQHRGHDVLPLRAPGQAVRRVRGPAQEPLPRVDPLRRQRQPAAGKAQVQEVSDRVTPTEGTKETGKKRGFNSIFCNEFMFFFVTRD